MSAPGRLLVFQVGPRVFAADVRDVVRIAPGGEGLAETLVPESCLGRPFQPGRGLVVRGDPGEDVLCVDGVLGVREPSPADLHELPALAAACLRSAAVRGLVVVDDAPMPLIDLPTLIRELRSGAAASAPGEPHA